LVQEILQVYSEEVSLLASQLRSPGLYHQTTDRNHPAVAVLVAQPLSRGLYLQTAGRIRPVLEASQVKV
jgi:hypothetical protein